MEKLSEPTELKNVNREKTESEKIEFSFLLVKPNGIKIGLKNIIRQELITAGFEIVKERDVRIGRFGAEVFYGSLGDRKEPVIEHITSGESHLFVVVGQKVIGRLRDFQGHTEWKDRPAKGLRGKYAIDHIQNTVHCPDSHKEAVDEFNLVFPDIRDELLKTQLSDELNTFLTDKESIIKGKKHLSTYAV